MKQRTRKQQRKQDEARNIPSPSPALCGALLCCLPDGVGKGLGAEGFDFSKVAPAFRAALGTARECQRVSAQAERGAGGDCIMLFCASVSPSCRAEMIVSQCPRGWLTREEKKKGERPSTLLHYFIFQVTHLPFLSKHSSMGRADCKRADILNSLLQ